MEFCSKKVLIVEDDVLLSVVEKRLVQKMGHEVINTIDSGEKALELIRQDQPDIVLMDVKLKGALDGIETVSEIRKEFSIPIIYLSGCSDNESRERAETVGFSGFLIKPVQMNDLEKAFKLVFHDEKVVQGNVKNSRQRVGHS